MSNYPPGVSGLEPQIAGYPERTIVKSCGAEGVDLRVIDPWLIERSKELIEKVDFSAVQGRNYSSDLNLSNYWGRGVYHVLLYLSQQDLKIEDTICPFDGEVDTQYDRECEWWICPLCGTEHEDWND